MTDLARRRAAAIVYQEARRAYGYVPADERDDDLPPACPACGGDGCEDCGFTGEMR